MSRHTNIVPKNVLSGSKNPQVQSRPSNRLLFRRKLSPGHEIVAAHRNSRQERTQRVEKTTGTVTNRVTNYYFRQNLLLGFSVSRYTDIAPKTYSASRKTPRNIQKRDPNYDLRQNRLLGITVSRYTERVPKNGLSGSKNPQVQQNRATFPFKDDLLM